MESLYTADATSTGGRDGRVRSSDGALALELAVPRELGGPGGPFTNPEQLFAAGYAACFENALRHQARGQKVVLGECSVTARVGIASNGAGGYELVVDLHARLPDLDRESAEQLVEEADRVCPYSNAIRGNVVVTRVVDSAPDVI